MSSSFDANIKSPVLSPMLNEFSEALITDENSKALELFAAVQIDSSGHSNMGSAVVGGNQVSQVTGRKQGAVVTCPGGEKIRVIALVSLDSAGNPVPFAAGSSAQAAKVTGKFQSTVVVATGSAQIVAHGLGVVPSMVLVAPQDNTAAGSTPFAFAIAEGTHTTTNVVFTATAGLKVKVIAFV